jgi:hypothetical protein
MLVSVIDRNIRDAPLTVLSESLSLLLSEMNL